MAFHIYSLGDHPAILLAAVELKKYLARISADDITVIPQSTYSPKQAGLWIGLASYFRQIPLPAVADDRLDDAISIQVDGGRGFIAGNNPRSVLQGAYRYLRALGCRWVRPGTDGEYLPKVDLESSAVHLTETPSYRHRALDLAGALSHESLLDVIDWCPKVGLSGAFLEFDTCLSVCNLWYNHALNPDKTPEPISEETAAQWRLDILEELHKRDMLYHSKGHGWVYEALGLRADQFVNPLPEDVVPYVALTGDERKSIGAGNTNLCYSNPEARRRFVETVAGYAAGHREADYLHVWLADGINNHCECEDCRKMRPADWYLVLMNELDAVLTTRGLDTRIVFLFYVDLLWPPECETITHPERFSLMFAPILRSYNVSFAEVPIYDTLPTLPPYQRNKLHFGRTVQESTDFVPHWMRVPHADAFDFDYQYWMWQYDDPSGLHRAKVVHGDIEHLARLGMDGLVGCYTLRSFYPVLGMYAMAECLWAKDMPFEALLEDYFPAAFGPEWRLCLDYLQRLSELFDPAWLAGEKPAVDPQMAEKMEQVPAVIVEFLPAIERNSTLAQPCWAASWRYLTGHAEITVSLARANAARARGETEEAVGLFEETQRLVMRYEDEMFPVMDSWLFSVYLDERAHPEKGQVP